MIEKQQTTHESVLDRLETGAIVLTGNARLSRSLMAANDRRMVGRGLEAWYTPTIVPLGAWVLEEWKTACLLGHEPFHRLLNAEQETQVWADVIREMNTDLLRPTAAARRARDAWSRIVDWKIHLADQRFESNDTSSQFKRWAQRFWAICQEHEYTTEAELPGHLADALNSGVYTPPKDLVLAGFWELTPKQLELVEALQGTGAQVDWIEISAPAGAAHTFKADDADSEIDTAARWARQTLKEYVASEANPAEPDPDPREIDIFRAPQIGIVVPDLAERRAQIAHVLARTLEPQARAPGALAPPFTWNISLGLPLSDYPIIRLAFALLGFMQREIPIETVGQALTSGLWAVPKKPAKRIRALSRRALLDAELRSTGEQRFKLGNLRFHASRTDDEGKPRPFTCRKLANRLNKLIKYANKELPRRTEPHQWAKHFARWLTLAGWTPGSVKNTRPPDSHEYQTVEHWHELLARFSSLGDFTGPVGRDTALSMLRRLAAETVFQPKSPGTTPVQVLGLYEAIGQQFDHLWVMGLDDRAWPPAPRPDPFIPLAIQRERRMPHCDPDAEFELTKEITKQLRHAAPNVVFSHPAREDDQSLSPSPLIRDFEPTNTDQLPLCTDPDWFTLIRESGRLEEIPLDTRIPLTRNKARGGSAIVRNQSACPFKAFAEHRLGARALDEPGAGLDPLRRGSLLHDVLERVWAELECHANLVALDEDQRRALVQDKVSESIDKLRKRNPQTLTRRYKQIETDRLVYQVLDWLNKEEQRSPFRVDATERKVKLDLDGLRMNIRMDRIDELDDGRQVILDYKTGKAEPSKWFGERPDDPQLPLYSVALDREATEDKNSDDQSAPENEAAEPSTSNLAAVAFAQIRAEETGFKGVVSDPGLLPGLPSGSKLVKEAAENWPDVLEKWSSVIDTLAGDFRRGKTEVDPKDYPKTCMNHYCDLAPLCRVGERLGPAGDDDDNGGWNEDD